MVYQPLLKMHRESRLDSIEEVRKLANAYVDRPASAGGGKRFSFDAIDPAHARGLGDTVLRRGSTRAFAPEAIAASELTTILSASSAHANLDFPRLSDTYLIVNSVEGLTPGAYYFDRDAKQLELLEIR